MSTNSEINPLVEVFESIFERVVDRVLEKRNALFPTVDAELAERIARINAKPNISVPEASLLLGCSDSHLYNKLTEARKGTTKYPIPFLYLDGVYVFPREKLLEWARLEKEPRPRRSLKSEREGD